MTPQAWRASSELRITHWLCPDACGRAWPHGTVSCELCGRRAPGLDEHGNVDVEKPLIARHLWKAFGRWESEIDLTAAERADLEIELREIAVRKLSTLHSSRIGLEAGIGSRDSVIKTDAKYTSHHSSGPPILDVGSRDLAESAARRRPSGARPQPVAAASDVEAAARPYALAVSWPVASSMLQVP